MDGDEILSVLKEIRDEAKQTNARIEQTNVRLGSVEGRIEQTNVRLESVEGRIDQTNVRLESVDGRLDFLERRVSKGFTDFRERFDSHAQRIDELARTQAEAEVRLATEIVSLATVTREVRDLLERKLDDHKLVVSLEYRVKALEDRDASRHQ